MRQVEWSIEFQPSNFITNRCDLVIISSEFKIIELLLFMYMILMWIKYFTDIWTQGLGHPGVTADSESSSTWIGKIPESSLGFKTSICHDDLGPWDVAEAW